MIKIETLENGEKTNIQLRGVKIDVLNEILNIAKHLSQDDDDYADALLMGIMKVIPKDEIIEKLDRIKNAEDLSNDIKVNDFAKSLKDLLDGLKKTIEEVELPEEEADTLKKKRKGGR